jgi:chromosome partitioning protein
VRSASPPAGTTDRASIAETSPAGEMSGRGAVPGSAQDGETSTVDQSREWPARDTASSQDPAESRLDSIWGADPPDSVRWHMDMTPGKGATASQALGAQSKPEHSARAEGQLDDTVDPAAPPSPSSVGADSPGDSSSIEGWSSDQPAVGIEGSLASANPTAADTSAAEPGAARLEPSAGSTSVLPSNQESPPVNSGQGTTAANAASAEEPTIGGSDTAIGSAGSSSPAATAEPGGAGADVGRGAAGVGGADFRVGSKKPGSGQAGSSAASITGRESGGEAATAASSIRSGAAGSSDQGAASGPGPKGGTAAVDASGEGTATGGSGGGLGRRGSQPGAAAMREGPIEDPPLVRERAGSEVGWFSSNPESIRFTLSERLSAERPVDEPSLDQVVDTQPPPRDSGDEKHGLPGTAASSGSGTAASSAGPESAQGESQGEYRGPELIEAGMVYVDPDPEIGAPPAPAGWTEPVGTQSGSIRTWADGDSGIADPSEHQAPEDPTPRDVIDSPAPGPVATTEHASANNERERTVPEVLDTGEVTRGGQPTPTAIGPAEAISANAVPGEDSPIDEVPWNEPALPMAWPSATAPSSSEEQGSTPHDDSAHQDLVPPPDPTWPRLFRAVEAPRDAEEPGERGDDQHRHDPQTNEAGHQRRSGNLTEAWSSLASGAQDIEADAEDPSPAPEQRADGEQGLNEAGGSTGDASGGSGRSLRPPGEIDLTTPGPPDSTSGPSEDPSAVAFRVAARQSPAATEARADSSSELRSPVVLGQADDAATDRRSSPDVTASTSDAADHWDLGAGSHPLAADALPAGRHSAESAGPGSGPSSASTTRAGGVGKANHANMSADARIADAGEADSPQFNPAGPRSADVSRETSAGGDEQVDRVREDGSEDEAAVAVREAVSRAAAEAGVDVSRETDPAVVDLSSDGLREDPSDTLTDEPSMDREAAAKSARVSFRIHRDSLNGSRRIVAVANQKGGVGKSTTAVNIGAYLALAGARVLVVDLDPQGNASTGLGLDHREIEPSLYDVLTGETSPAAAIRATGVANLHILPSTIDLAGAEVELVSAMSRETRLRRALQSIDQPYDIVLIDCPPSLGLLTVNALAAADELLIPIQCEYYALEGLGQLLRNVELVRANLNPELRIGGIVLTMYDSRTRLALQVVDEVRKHFSEIVYQTVVPRSVRLSEAPGYGLPIALYDPLSRGGIAYRDLTFELAERSGLLAPTGEGAS